MFLNSNYKRMHLLQGSDLIVGIIDSRYTRASEKRFDFRE